MILYYRRNKAVLKDSGFFSFSFLEGMENQSTERNSQWVSVDPGETAPFSFDERGNSFSNILVLNFYYSLGRF